jgi:hypothetical protein
MSTTQDRIRQVDLKLQRAKQHFTQLGEGLKVFFDSQPYGVSAKHDPITRRLIYSVSSVKDIPDAIPLAAGDVLQNLMTALDHLAYQLVCKDTHDSPPAPNHIYFPIADDLNRYNAKKGLQLEGALPGTIAAIDAVRPYKDGNDALWKLSKLNNIEKHRLLLTVGAQAAGIHAGQLMASHLPPSFGAWAIDAMKSMNAFLMPADNGFPLSPGFELYIGAPDEPINPGLIFRFLVVLQEPGIVEGQPLTTAIADLIQIVEAVVSSLRTRL